MLTLKSDNIARMTRNMWSPVPDWQLMAAAECLDPAPGTCIIEQQPDYSMSLLQTGNRSVKDQHSNRQVYRDWKEQSTGTVLAMGDPLPIEDPRFIDGNGKALAGSKFLPETLKAGDKVLFRWWWSTAIRNLSVACPEKGWYFASEHARYFGRAFRLKNRDDLSRFIAYPVPLHELIMAHVNVDPETNMLMPWPLTPYKRWILGLRDELNEESESGLFLVPTLTNRKNELVILEAGSDCVLVGKAGERWQYAIEAQEHVAFSIPGIDKRVVLIPEEALWCRCRVPAVDPMELWMEAHAERPD